MMAAKLQIWSKLEECGVVRFLYAKRLTPAAICGELVAVMSRKQAPVWCIAFREGCITLEDAP
jgi:hypothetical protein